jgi:hypothetical protein
LKGLSIWMERFLQLLNLFLKFSNSYCWSKLQKSIFWSHTRYLQTTVFNDKVTCAVASRSSWTEINRVTLQQVSWHLQHTQYVQLLSLKH